VVHAARVGAAAAGPRAARRACDRRRRPVGRSKPKPPTKWASCCAPCSR
jgi:hypothetical protein